MKQFLVCLCLTVFLLSCNNDEKTAATSSTSPDSTKTTTPPDLPYKASYSTSFTTDVSDADLKTVLLSYKYWADSNITELGKVMGDSVDIEMSSGEHFSGTNANLMKRWSMYRDSLRSVKIDMTAWQKMYSTDKKEAFIVTWYDETDTYKNGRVDSAAYHDINKMVNGKITWYSQYKRPKR